MASVVTLPRMQACLISDIRQTQAEGLFKNEQGHRNCLRQTGRRNGKKRQCGGSRARGSVRLPALVWSLPTLNDRRGRLKGVRGEGRIFYKSKQFQNKKKNTSLR